MQRSEWSSKKRSKFSGQLTGFTERSVVMDYDKMKALWGASREGSSAQRNPEVRELSKLDSRPDWKYLDYVAKERIAA